MGLYHEFYNLLSSFIDVGFGDIPLLIVEVLSPTLSILVVVLPLIVFYKIVRLFVCGK